MRPMFFGCSAQGNDHHGLRREDLSSFVPFR
jgi:hypothetical protein